MDPLISVASVLQVAEARIMAPDLAKVFGAESAESGHPDNGERPVPDELAEIVANLIAPVGRQPCKWLHGEFTEVVNDYMQAPPCLLATKESTEYLLFLRSCALIALNRAGQNMVEMFVSPPGKSSRKLNRVNSGCRLIGQFQIPQQIGASGDQICGFTVLTTFRADNLDCLGMAVRRA
jgi:hypothetical protein